MPTAIATTEPVKLDYAIQQAVLHGDLAHLTIDQRMQYHRARCRAAGFNELARPFAYIRVRGEKGQPDRLVLYCLREGAEQLNQMHGITHSVSKIDCDQDGGIMEVFCQAQTRDGRSTFEIGVVSIMGLKGKDLAIAKMKAITVAKRRATLSLCGLGDMMDESELENVPTTPTKENGDPIKGDNGTGHGLGMYESEEKAGQFLKLIEDMLVRVNTAWLDRWTDKATNAIPPGVPEEYCNRYRLDNHLVKWGIATGKLDEKSLSHDKNLKARQEGRISSILWFRSKEDRAATATEMKEYLERCQRETIEKMKRKNPELFSEIVQTPEMSDGELMDGDDEPANINSEELAADAAQ